MLFPPDSCHLKSQCSHHGKLIPHILGASPAPSANAGEARPYARHLGASRQEVVRGARSLFVVMDLTGIVKVVTETMEFYHNRWLSKVHAESVIESLPRLLSNKWIIL